MMGVVAALSPPQPLIPKILLPVNVEILAESIAAKPLVYHLVQPPNLWVSLLEMYHGSRLIQPLGNGESLKTVVNIDRPAKDV